MSEIRAARMQAHKDKMLVKEAKRAMHASEFDRRKERERARAEYLAKVEADRAAQVAAREAAAAKVNKAEIASEEAALKAAPSDKPKGAAVARMGVGGILAAATLGALLTPPKD